MTETWLLLWLGLSVAVGGPYVSYDECADAVRLTRRNVIDPGFYGANPPDGICFRGVLVPK